MKHSVGKTLLSIILIVLFAAAVSCTYAEVTTTVILRTSKLAQKPVVNVGEDLCMEVVLDGVTPDTCQWYFEDRPIAGADQRIYNIVDAKVEDSGVYRMDAFDENGKMLVSIDINARVIDPSIPKSGDTSFPIEIAGGILLTACAVLFTVFRRREAR